MTPLLGHDHAVARFRAALDSRQLHHAWLISGPIGIGKALFADKAALRVLAQGIGPVGDAGIDVPDDNAAARLAAAGSHPDLQRLERLGKDGGADLARSITVEQVRGLQRLLTTTPSLSPWRAIVIDAVDDLERNAANALLKHLEEPPSHTVFLLVSHAPDRLLPTIRSRCRPLRLHRLTDDVMASALRIAAPEASEIEIEALVRAGEGAPGKALAIRGLDIESIERSMRILVEQGDPTNAIRSALAHSLALKAAQPRYEAFLARAPAAIAAKARSRRGTALADALLLWDRATSLAGSARRQSLDPQSTAFELAGLLASLASPSDRQNI